MISSMLHTYSNKYSKAQSQDVECSCVKCEWPANIVKCESLMSKTTDFPVTC